VNGLRVVWHLAKADFLERVRRPGFLITLGLAVYLGYVVSAGQLKLWLGDYRGVYNSAWVGLLMALVANMFLSLAGFYVVKNAVERDRRTGVGQILATTPLSKPLYALGKAASNLAVLLAMVGVLAAMGVVAQLVAGEDRHVELGKLLAPFLFLCVPAMAVVAALAVLFEMVPFLSGGLGNAVWFFAWGGIAPSSMLIAGFRDPFGLGVVTTALFREMYQRFGRTDHSMTLGMLADERRTHTFVWQGMDWTGGIVLGQLAWLLGAVAIALVAALLFDRFDPSRRGRGIARRRPVAPLAGTEPADGAVALPLPVPATLTPLTLLSLLPPGARRFGFRGFVRLLAAEARLLLKGQRWWWYAVALGLWIATLTTPLATARGVLLPIAWIWPLLLWSALGSREARHDTGGLVFSAAHPLGRQLSAAWGAGALLAMATGGAVALRLLLAHDWAGVGAWLVGALFIPTLALALGAWSGGGKLFEVVYLVFWYLGPMQHLRAMDYLGSAPAAVAAGMPLVYLAATGLLGLAAVAARQRQLARG
jgi:hypothetical protein